MLNSLPVMDEMLEQLNALEGCLVREFRASQELLQLTKDEWLALEEAQTSRLVELAKQKESLLDQIAMLERDKVVYQSTVSTALKLESTASHEDVLDSLVLQAESDISFRLSHLQGGIEVVMDRVRDRTRRNYALAATSLERSDTLQSFLVGLCQVTLRQPGASAFSQSIVREDEGEKGQSKLVHESFAAQQATEQKGLQASLPAVFAAMLAAQDALESNDRAAVAAAVEALKGAFGNMNQYFSRNGIQPWPVQVPSKIPGRESAARSSLSGDLPNATLVEMIAGLYQQGAAYQAVLRASQRALSMAS